MGAIIGYGWYELLIYHPVKVHPVEELKADRPFNNSAVTGYPVGFV